MSQEKEKIEKDDRIVVEEKQASSDADAIGTSEDLCVGEVRMIAGHNDASW